MRIPVTFPAPGNELMMNVQNLLIQTRETPLKLLNWAKDKVRIKGLHAFGVPGAGFLGTWNLEFGLYFGSPSGPGYTLHNLTHFGLYTSIPAA
jgi:hypothetical protein